jgi:hypothetical protein
MLTCAQEKGGAVHLFDTIFSYFLTKIQDPKMTEEGEWKENDLFRCA